MSKELITATLNGIRKAVSASFVETVKSRDAAKCIQRIERLFDHAVIGGKYSRSRLMLAAYDALDNIASVKHLEQAARVAACLELLQSYLLIMDDVMDSGKTRRGKPCWHTMPDVGLGAVNDAVLLDCAVSHILRVELCQHPNAVAVSNVFADAKKITVMGQMLDGNTKGIDGCKWERYNDIVEHKTSYYTYYAPLQIALLMADIRALSEESKKISFKMGYLFQSQDDYLDCFGDPKITGKVGTDLREGKCTWVTCKTVEKLFEGSSQEAVTFQENFGKQSIESENKLKEIISNLKIAEDFTDFQYDYSNKLMRDIEKFPNIPLKNVFRRSLGEILCRQK